MAITLDTSISGEQANSYVDAAYLQDYWSNHYNTTVGAQVLALTQKQQEYLLVRACRILESIRCTRPIARTDYQLRYNRLTGTIVDIAYLTREPVKWAYFQRLQFPRNLDVDPQTGQMYIPEPIMMAQCEQAAFLLNFDDTAIANRLQGITMDKTSIGRSQIDLTQEYASNGSMIAPMAYEFMRQYMLLNAKLRRG